MNMEISKERMLEMAKKLAKMDFCPEQKVFYKNVLEMLQADAEGRLVILPCAVAEEVEYTSAVDEEKARKGKVIAISMLLSESVRRMEMQVMIESGAVIPFEKNDFEKRVLRRS